MLPPDSLDYTDTNLGLSVPADVQADPAKAASQVSKDSYDIVLEGMPIRVGKEFVFSFQYVYQNPTTGTLINGPSSALFRTGLQIVDRTEAVSNLSVKAGYKSYELKWDPVTFEGFIDLQVFESYTSDFAVAELKYVGKSNQVNILTANTTARYVKVITRDKWNNSKTYVHPTAIIPLNPDPDTSTPPSPPSGAVATGSIDSNDLSGFGGQIIVSWTANTDSNTSGYIIRWSTDNPSSVATPNWEYGQVEGKTVTSFKVTGLLLNTTYYYQVTAKSPYNSLSWTASPVQTLSPIVDSTAGGAWSRIKSFLTIGGATGDLFKFGTAIPASLNFSTTTTPSLTSGTYNGTILNISTTNVGNNYWLNTGRFRVGSATSFLYWDGLDIYTTGKINATGGSFTGDVQLNGGSLYAGSLPNSGQRVRLNSSGIFAYNSSGTQTFSLDTAGYINAISGLIGGWTLGSTSLSSNGVTISNTGQISLGDTATNSVYLSSVDTGYRLWIGSNSGSNAPFRVSKAGVLYASGATIDGNSSISGTVSIGGSSASTVVSNANGALQPGGTLTGSVSGTATINGTTASTVVSRATGAVQPGNGVGVNATTRTIETITAGTTLTLKSGGAKPVILDNTGLRMNDGTQDTLFLDASTGSAVFRGTIYASAGSFAGSLSAASGTFSGTITSGNGSSLGDWKVDSEGTLGSGLGLGGTYLYANSASGSGVTFSIYTGKMIFAAQGFSSTAAAPIVFANASPQISSAGGVRINNAFAPSADDSFSLGYTTARWQIVRSAGGVSTTSDRRIKTNIETSDLGLDFIKLLKPVKYKFISGGKVPANGVGPIIVDDKVVDTEYIDIPGVRDHYGFIAQDVKEAIDISGVNDFAGWQLEDKDDPDSQQALVHHHFIAPLTKAVQELSNMVESLQQEVNTLKGI
jgi:hypothetical protein